eukprot:m.631489 g.631489  ORF g.631489 m.631489 type:complete len:417 (+) comp22573_c0_seq25:564-1814(+)
MDRVEILVFLAALRTCFGDRADSKPTQRAAVVSVESSASYRGERKSGIHSEPHGFGRMEWSNGDVYTGYFADGRPHGDGQFKHSSGHVSEGYWRHGVRVDSPPHPDSKLHPDPNLYPESQLPAGKQAGVVKGGRSWGQFMVSRSLTAKDEQTFYDVAALAELTQVNVNATDAPMLAVTMHVERTDSNGVKTEQVLAVNRSVAQDMARVTAPRTVRLTYALTDAPEKEVLQYSGVISSGIWHGRGTLTVASVEHIEKVLWKQYSGDWKMGRMHGTGTLMWADGSVYNGEWEDGMRHGVGRMKYPPGHVKNRVLYDGEWRHNTRSGSGKLTWRDGDTYQGTWVDDLRTGHGTYTWSNGDIYVGGWSQGQRHGLGMQHALHGHAVYDVYERGENHCHCCFYSIENDRLPSRTLLVQMSS